MSVTNYGWASLVLIKAGLPNTVNNQQSFVRWMAAENPVGDWWNHQNPLNINASGFGYDTFPDLGVAATITAQVLLQNNMSGIANALRSNADLATFSRAVVAAPWAESHYGGNPLHFTTIPLPGVVAWNGYNPGPTPAPTPSPSPEPTPPPAPPINFLEDFTVNCQDPTSGGTWIVDPTDGHVETAWGAPYLGALNEPTPDRNQWKAVGNIVGITPWRDDQGSWGYAIIVRHFTPLANGAWYSPYTFARNGSNA